MIFVSIEDFFEKAEQCQVLTRQEELACAEQMKAGDTEARDRLIESYLPMTARHVKRAGRSMQNLGLAVYCVDALEKAVDSFNFFQDGETFTHRLSWYLRNASARYIAEH